MRHLCIYREKTLKKKTSSSDLTSHDLASQYTVETSKQEQIRKLKQCYFPQPERKRRTQMSNTADIYLHDHAIFGYFNKFKYLGTIFTPSLKDDLNINRRITSAVGAFATMKKVLYNHKIPAKLRVRIMTQHQLSICSYGVAKAGHSQQNSKRNLKFATTDF